MRMKMSQKQLFECSGDILKHHCSFPISLFQICILIKIISVHQVQLFTINQIYNELSDLEANSSAAGWSLAWHRHELTSEGPWCQGLTWTPGGGWSDSGTSRDTCHFCAQVTPRVSAAGGISGKTLFLVSVKVKRREDKVE